ncbi:MAG: hypothetical protein AAFP02_06615 [Bacteroidota bacterium]
MTGEEKRKLLKEQMKAQYKKDLQLRKEFLEKAEGLKRSQKLNNVVSDIVGSLDDDTDDWIDQLNSGSAVSEAKLDMMLDQATETSRELDRLAKEAEMQKMAAEDLVTQMKREMGIEVPEKPAAEERSPKEESTPKESPKAESDPPAEKKPPKPNKSLGDF